jgi:predicted  nucleic acid-binding Zn-ribbon protein
MRGISITEFRKHSKEYQKNISSIEQKLDSLERNMGNTKSETHKTSLDGETKKILEYIKLVKNRIKD